MPALQLTRRGVLSAGVVAVASVAGCSGAEEPDDTPRDPRSGPPEDAVTDLETVSVRWDHPDTFVALDGEEGGMMFLVESADKDALAFDPAPPGTDDARALVEETDFETHAVGVYQEPLGSCYRRHAEYVIPSEDEVGADFCRILRDASVDCESDEQDMVATFVRFPFPYDESPSTVSYGSGSSCESAHWQTEGSR